MHEVHDTELHSAQCLITISSSDCTKRRQEALAVASIARDDPSPLPCMHRDHSAPACTATRSACPHAGALLTATTMRGKFGSEFET